MADFFEKPDETQEEPQKIKLGDQEYDPKELEELVGLGKLGKEVEEKYNTKLDKVYPEFTKATQKVKELEPKVAELETIKAQMATQQQNQGGLTQEQITQAREQLYQILGGKPMTDNELKTWYTQQRAEETNVIKLLSDVDNLVADVKANGKPEVDKKELLEWMNENGVGNPVQAYKLMKEEEIDTWKMNKINSGKKQGLFTMSSSTAGGKEPSQVKPSLQNLNDLVSEALGQTE